MKQIARAVAFILALLPTVVLAQANLPYHSVWGRVGATPGDSGPAQAIPFSVLGPALITSNLLVTSPLSISGLTLSITGASGQILAGSPAAFTFAPTLGVSSTSTGSLAFATSGGTGKVTVQAPTTSTSWTFKFPTTAGLNGQALTTDGNGNTAWSAGSGTVNSGAIGQVAFYSSTGAAISGLSTLNISAGALVVGIAGSQAGTVALSGSTSGTTVLAVPATTSGTLTLPAATDTLVGKATTDTLTNKTLTSPTINSPTMTTPTLGVASATSINKVAITAPATGSTLTVADGKTLTDTSGVGASVLLGATGGGFSAYAGATCTNQFIRILSAAGIATCASVANTDLANSSVTIGSTNVALGGTASTVAGLTLTAPTINGGTAQALTNLGVRSSGSGAFDIVIANTENLTAQRALTLTLNNAARAINLSGNVTTASDFSTAGANPITLTSTGSTNVTMPTSGTLAAINIAQTFSSQNIFSALQQFSDIKFSSGKLFPTADSTTALQVMKADGLTSFVTFDSTNKRVGINKTPGAFDLDVNGAVNVGAALTFGTLDPTSLSTSPTTITGLTVNNSPNSSNDYLLYYNAASGSIRKATVGAIAAGATAGVSSLNGLTGGLSVVGGSSAIQVSAAGSSVTLTPLETFFPSNCSLAASVTSNILTVALKDNGGNDPTSTSPCRIPFRSATAATGAPTFNNVTSALSITTFATGATLGSTNAKAFRFWVVAFDNAGTTVLSLFNAVNQTSFSCAGINEGVVQSSTAVSGSATSSGIYYTPNGTALSSKAIRVIGYVEYNSTGLTTAGTYASAPNFIQIFGPGISRPCTPVQSVDALTTADSGSSTASFVANTGFAVSITPQSAANLISVELNGSLQTSAAGLECVVQISRGTTNATNMIGAPQAGFVSTAGLVTAAHAKAKDYPNTISSTTYAGQRAANVGAGTCSWPTGGIISTNTGLASAVEIQG